MVTTTTVQISYIFHGPFVSCIIDIKHSWCRGYLSSILELLLHRFLTITVFCNVTKLVTVIAFWFALESTLSKMQFPTMCAGIFSSISGFVIPLFALILPILMILAILISSGLS
ncbi:unnamed protein product [Prunus brigantina]